jgi:signal transduction histidine kinase
MKTRPLPNRTEYTKLKVEEGLPAIYADSDRIRQVVLNLVNNAIKYAKDGRKIIIGAAGKGNDLQVEVRDFGPGISESRAGRNI